MIKRISLLLALFVPWVLLIASYNEYCAHYDYLQGVYFLNMENSYFLGCAKTGDQDKRICRIRAIEHVLGFQ